MKPAQKFSVYNQHHLKKECKVCRIDQSHVWEFVFCDSCDDGYHWKCLDPPLTAYDVQAIKVWLCPSCIEIERKNQNKIKNIPQNCYKCKQSLKNIKKYVDVVVTDQHGVQRFAVTPVPEPLFKICRHCKNYFHSQNCFSERPNCLNCAQCQSKIRKEGPKCHSQFISYIKQDLKQIEKHGFVQIHDQGTEMDNEQQYEYQRLETIGLKVFQYCGDWQTICRVESSLYYSLKSNNLHYTNSQLYQNLKTLSLNNPTKNIYIPYSLSKCDERVYKAFREMTNINHYQPAIEIKQDYVKGFYAVAAQYIPSHTLICQYVGQVFTKKQTIQRHQGNDSVMSLIVTHFAETGLDIVPELFSGVSKFISGVPDSRRDMVNIQTLNFSYRGRSHILFYTIKPIESGETLYIDYNGGILQQFPTEKFTV